MQAGLKITILELIGLQKKNKALAEEKARLTKQNDRLMEFLTNQIDKAGYKQLQTKNHLLKPRNYRAKTVIDNEALLPDVYKKKEEVIKIDKKQLYSDLKDGIEVAGARLEPNRKTTII